MKNSPIEQLVFEEFLITKGLNSSDLVYSGGSSVRFDMGGKKVSAHLSEITGEKVETEKGLAVDPPGRKVRTSLIRHLKRDFEDQGGEVWLFLFTHPLSLSGDGRLNKDLPEIEQLVLDFLMSKRQVAKIIIFEMGLKEAVLEVSRG